MCSVLSVVLVVIRALHVSGPEGEVIAEELHDEGGVLVRVLGEGVEVSDGVVKGLLGETAGAVGGSSDLVVKDREVEGEAETDGVSGSELLLSDFRGGLVGVEGSLAGFVALLAGEELSEVAVVVTLHLVVEDLGLAGGGAGDEVLVEEAEDVSTDVGELSLDLAAVLADSLAVGIVAALLLLLLNAAHNAPGGTTGTDNVLVGNAEKVALLNGKLGVELTDSLHGRDHLVIALGLLSKLGKVDVVLTCGHFWLCVYVLKKGENKKTKNKKERNLEKKKRKKRKNSYNKKDKSY